MKIKKNIEDTEKVSTRDKKPKKKKKGCLIGIVIFVVLLIIGALNSGDSRKDTEANQGAKQKVEQKVEQKAEKKAEKIEKKVEKKVENNTEKKEEKNNKKVAQKLETKSKKKLDKKTEIPVSEIKKHCPHTESVKMNGDILDITYDKEILSPKSAYSAFVFNSIHSMQYISTLPEYSKITAVRFTQPAEFIDDNGNKKIDTAISASINVENTKDVNWKNMRDVVAFGKYKFFKHATFRVHPAILNALPDDEKQGLQTVS